MIEKTTAFKVGEQFFPCIEEAQKHELAALLESVGESGIAAASLLISHKEEVLNILTMTPKSHAKARKANGATRKPRTPKVVGINSSEP